jgi:3-oxoacyl-[acyl-carrier-protein] synthase II
MDRLCALSVVAADGALRAAAIDPASVTWEPERVAVALATAYGCHQTNEDFYRGLLGDGASPRLFAYTLPSSPVGEISIHYRICGPATTLAPGLTAGVEALLEGARHLRRGRADRALAVAADVATPLLERALGVTGLRDGAAAVLLERSAAGQHRLLGGDVAFAGPVDGGRAKAVHEATKRALLQAGQSAREVALLVAPVADAEAARAAGVTAPLRVVPPETLGASALTQAVHALADAPGLLLVVAGDPAGRGAAALLC